MSGRGGRALRARRLMLTGAAASSGAALYLAVSSGRVTLDLGVGRREQALGPLVVDVEAQRETVYAVIAEPYLGRTTRAMREKVRVLERGEDVVLAEHVTVINSWLSTKTLETVRFSRPGRVDFRLVRGPVPSVTERFELEEHAGMRTTLRYEGTLATDLWGFGTAWGRVVARRWNATVAASLASIKDEAERRGRR